MTALVAFLTFAIAAPSSTTAAGPLAIDGVERADRVLLPRSVEPVSVHVHALAGLVIVEGPRPSVLARAIRMTPRTSCPDLDQTASGVVLHCRSRRIVARIDAEERGHVLEIAETRGLPWRGEDAAPIVPFDPSEIALGDVCPGSTPAGRAECLLGRGDRTGARKAFSEVAGSQADAMPSIRLGDLAFAEGDVLAATSHWSRARGAPWERLAEARLCELSWTCIAAADLRALYRTDGMPPSIARDLALRHARTLAFLGRPLQGAQVLLGEVAGERGCTSAITLCRDVAAAALSSPDAGAVDALALWLASPHHEDGPETYQAAVSAAAIAEREGAPTFAANLLAAVAGQAPARVLRNHLLRTAELFLAGGDRVRAGVVLEFARARAGDRGLAGARWEAVVRAVREPAATASPRQRHGRDAARLDAADHRAARTQASAEGVAP